MNITFIRQGAMNAPMVKRLLLAQFSVPVFSRASEKADSLIKIGVALRIKWILEVGFVEEGQVVIDGKNFIRLRLNNPAGINAD